ncbi:MAG: RagB/SusD family nutrient uptake outer membrane protein [Bacteroidetes bacterium]|nr:RagB/SusD family nutrient uptake outer membrane protein [Bacteroidota bacterium]MBS1974507.1 RagB/SusD family nutrient uptake outer membrane protein [Bacteroidota bacterium]
MKTFNKHILTLIGSGSLLLFASCKKFLDQKPVSSITTDNAYTTGSDIESALTGAYSSFMATNFYQWERIMQTDNRSDNAYCGGSNDIDYYQLDLNTIPNTNGSVSRAWTELYASIAKANIIIDNIANIKDITDTRRSQINGEAHFLRAFHYYQLVSLFSGVPLEQHSNSADPNVINIPRSTESQTYDFINNDLQIAVQGLPVTFGAPNIDKVRATKGAAYALLAKIWAQRADRDYNKVSAYCDSVINQGDNYSLLPVYDNLFDGNHNYNAESIMEIPYLANTPQANWGTELLYPTHDDQGNVPGDAWQRYCVPSKTLVAAYASDSDTIRKKATISFEIAPWSDDYWNPCGDPGTPIPFAFKQRHPANWSGGDHTYLLRFADIILLKAEALNETGQANQALNYINQIKARAGLTSDTNTSQSQLRLDILRERQLELAFEGQRWNDLKRYNEVIAVMNNLGEAKYTCNNGTESAPIAINYNFNANNILLPLPLTELQANPKLVQNPGY